MQWNTGQFLEQDYFHSDNLTIDGVHQIQLINGTYISDEGSGGIGLHASGSGINVRSCMEAIYKK